MKDFRRLNVWEKSHLLTLDVYKVTAKIPSGRNVWPQEPNAQVQCFNGS